MKQRDDDIAEEIEILKQKIKELEQLAKGRGLTGLLFQFRHPHTSEEAEKAKHSS